MRGDREKSCFTYIQSALFGKNGSPITNPFNGKTYLTASDMEFSSEMLFYINGDATSFFFGLTEQDRAEFYEIMRKTKPNPSTSTFPDFVFDKGFIEHFSITSSVENRKGSKQKITDIAFDAMVKNESQIFEEECNSKPFFDQIRSKQWTTTNPEHSYANLITSFQSSWEHHMNSYHKYTGNKATGIFMIENMEFSLSMYENVYSEWINGMSHGDYRNPENFKCHKLSRDKN